MRTNKIKVFYTPNQVLETKIEQSTSKSPLKPKLLMEQLFRLNFGSMLEVNSDFQPFDKEDFMIAHTEQYVHDMLHGVSPLCHSNSVPWSPQLAQTVRYTNASLYNAIRTAVLNPDQITFSPTSGFHHARPTSGAGFCTFSGQVIASTKIYRELGKVGSYVDLDGHFGNSIEDSRQFVRDLDLSIPRGFNINPEGSDESYLQDLTGKLQLLEQEIIAGRIHYVVFCHGADSHQWDDLGHQCSTEYWVKCSEVFYTWVKRMDAILGYSLPVTLSLFGGYRRDSYSSVLNLHTKDIVTCLNILCGHDIDFTPEVKPKHGYGYELYRRPAPAPRTKPLSKNEKDVLDYLKNLEDDGFRTGMDLGNTIRGWKNHSMSKWCLKLVQRGLLEVGKNEQNQKGFRFKSN